MTMQDFLQLTPLVQSLIVIAIATTVITFIWQMWKTFREN